MLNALKPSKRYRNGRDLVLLYRDRFNEFIKPDGLFERYCRDSAKDYRLAIDEIHYHLDRNGRQQLIASYIARKIAPSDIELEILIKLPVMTLDEFEKYPKDYSRCKQIVTDEFNRQLTEKFP